MTELTGQGAIVTGAASGVGAGIARALAAAGARVIVADPDAEGARGVASEIDGHALEVDISLDASVGRLAYHVADLLEDVDIVVNTAGIMPLPAPLEDASEAEFDRVLAVTAKSIFLTARHFVPGMKARGRGAILNVATTTGLPPRPRPSWDTAGKGWMISATKAMAVELAPYAIRVNALAPVAEETSLLAGVMWRDTSDAGANVPATIPLDRFSIPQDIAEAAAFLCSDAASLITGTVLDVDGGRCI